MGSTLKNVKQNIEKKEVMVAEIVFSGEKMVLPEGMSLEDAKNLLEARQEWLETDVRKMEKFDVFPWDGALALEAVLNERFGWAQARGTPGWFGDNPPSLIGVETGPGQITQVPWGRFSLPGVQGFLQCSATKSDERMVFELNAQFKRKDEAAINDIFAKLRKYLAKHSIYRGKAIRMRFRDDEGDALNMPEPKFIDVSKVDRNSLICSKHVMDSIETNLFTPIERAQDCLDNDIPIKRGVLLGGTYGTGKTLAATVASRVAVDAGLTFLYVPRADELAEAIQFAKQYQSPACVVFCEDIDRVLDGERDVEMDDILNTIDGIDSKNSNIIVVLTTNNLRAINVAMLRPGRLDAVIDVTPPDAEAVEKLLWHYGKGVIAKNANLHAVGEELAGCIPAVVAEVVKRAKLVQLRLQPPGNKVKTIGEQALLEAAITMRAQLKLMDEAGREDDGTPVTLDVAMQDVVERVFAERGNEEVQSAVKSAVDRAVKRARAE